MGAQGQAHQGVPGVGGKGAERPRVGPHQIEAPVAEGGHGVPHAVVDPPPPAEVLDKPHRQQRSPHPLRQESPQEDLPDKGRQPAQPAVADAADHDLPLPEPQPPPQQQQEQGGNGHKAQPSDLDQADDDHLPKGAPISPRVLQHQPRNAGGGGGGEQRVAKGRPAGDLSSPGEHQQPRPHQDHDKEAQRDNLDAGELRLVPLKGPKALIPSFHCRSRAAFRITARTGRRRRLRYFTMVLQKSKWPRRH